MSEDEKGRLRRTALVVAGVTACLLAARGSGPARAAPSGGPTAPAGDGVDDPLVVFVSVPPQAWLVRRLLRPGDRVEVMVPPGASPRTYEPGFTRMRALADADLYLAVGHPGFAFERAWLGELRKAAPSMRVVDTGRECARDRGDPHLWLSPPCAERMAAASAGAVVALRPARADEVERGLEELRATVRDVDAAVAEKLAPYEGRSFLVFHPAWGYFARRYGLEQLAVETAGMEPNPRELAQVMEEARREGVTSIFVQPQFSGEAAGLLARDLGLEMSVLDPLAEDWAANLLEVAEALRRALRSTHGRTPTPATEPG